MVCNGGMDILPVNINILLYKNSLNGHSFIEIYLKCAIQGNSSGIIQRESKREGRQIGSS